VKQARRREQRYGAMASGMLRQELPPLVQGVELLSRKETERSGIQDSASASSITLPQMRREMLAIMACESSSRHPLGGEDDVDALRDRPLAKTSDSAEGNSGKLVSSQAASSITTTRRGSDTRLPAPLCRKHRGCGESSLAVIALSAIRQEHGRLPSPSISVMDPIV
jgi:hypothetical protein